MTTSIEIKMDHKELKAWQIAIDLVKQIYAISNIFPDSEKFGLTSQIRRAAVSVATNIAEGAARKSDKELIQFLYISLGSLSEVDTLLIIAVEIKYVGEIDIERISSILTENRKLIIGLIKYLKNKN